jgi:hypothetical protein
MKKLAWFIVIVGTFYLGYTYRYDLFDFLVTKIVYKEENELKIDEDYKIKTEFNFVKQTDDFQPYSYNDILDILYSGLNNGWQEFTFFCPSAYISCIEDTKDITSNQVLISYLNNFVHPYNAFNSIKITISNLNRITIAVEHLYNEEDRNLINQKVDEIYGQVTNEDMQVEEKFRVIHDYIINNSIYDSEKADNLNNPQFLDLYNSSTAYGPLIEGYGICGGYSDAMELFLIKMGLPNYKVSSQNHVWNLVYLNGKWQHLDLTWDDPVVNTKENMLLHNFFLITTSKLNEINTGQHNFNEKIFKEALEA